VGYGREDFQAFERDGSLALDARPVATAVHPLQRRLDPGQCDPRAPAQLLDDLLLGRIARRRPAQVGQLLDAEPALLQQGGP
jgi:hypothetical protein